MKTLAVLISGSGSNLQAIMDASQNGTLDAEICVVVSNKPDAYGLKRAEKAGMATRVVNHRDYSDRESFDRALATCLDDFNPDILALAGFMRILTPFFVEKYLGRMVNIHPSLLPKYPGLDTHARALAAGDREHGCSIHFVTPDLDGGPVIAQSTVPVEKNDTAETLAGKVLEKEHVLYPFVLQLLAQDKVQLEGDCAVLEGTPLKAGQLMV